MPFAPSRPDLSLRRLAVRALSACAALAGLIFAPRAS